jgi:tryptophan halogenase
MNDRRIRSILIVGGGTAGWLAAGYLRRALDPATTIALVESSDVPRIGVGEATVPTLKTTLGFIGIDERDWMARCNGTFKMAIKFVNWRTGNDDFYHPFFARPGKTIRLHDRPYFPEIGAGLADSAFWAQSYLCAGRSDYARLASSTPALCDRNQCGDPTRHSDAVTYAYHMDAGLLAAYLRDFCVERGVRHVIDHIQEVHLDDHGAIAGIDTVAGSRLEADLYIDCSGFKGLLINEALHEPFVDQKRYLINDSALAISVRNDPQRLGIRPYTTATAHSAGWSWDIPLYHRNGCGYVYSSDHISRDAAESEIRAHFGDAAEGVHVNAISMRVGYNRRVWVKNCLAMGLAGSFIEPLESTSIFMTEYQLANLVSCFPDRTFSDALMRRYNHLCEAMYLQIRDFIVLHYVTTKREDTTYWRHMKHELPIPDSLAALLDDYKNGLPLADSSTPVVFRNSNVVSVLSGMHVFPERSLPILEHVKAEGAEAHFAAVRSQTARLLDDTPDHYAYLTSIRDPGSA